MNHDQNIYVYGTEKQPEAGPIGPAILFVGALATAGLWVNELFKWIQAVAADPISRPYEALIVAGMGCIGAYYAWRTVRMAYLMTCSLCFLTCDSARKIFNFAYRRRNQQ
ncbi:hypothetical protein [Phyllobacterium sophorae]|uniref:Uncharacterized protein n=1 Tax=Phyllobacterium sophorae TaxID=1520277 RepID=A0A2P7AQK8_9HYPH|nr:hypothetical protein [Phyllobacterium sophorae]PSH56511.1 hypothetical protein CU103_29335 [Phyllobacterium sophorae]